MLRRTKVYLGIVWYRKSYGIPRSPIGFLGDVRVPKTYGIPRYSIGCIGILGDTYPFTNSSRTALLSLTTRTSLEFIK